MHLLSLEIIDINARNLVGLTPLDVLLETTQEIGDVFIGEILRRAGGKISEEFNPRSADDAADTLLPNLVSSQNNQTNGKGTRKLTDADELSTDNLIVVAALVATVTYQAIFNPPGGFIQMPFETSDGNSTKHHSWYTTWQHFPSGYPVGKPALLWKLEEFIVADSIALFLSCISILLILSGLHRKKKGMMKIVV
jgi:Domain of unknown function